MRGGRFQEKERSSEDGGSMRNAEMLFQTRSIADIREVEARTRKDIEEKKEELRQLVGASYRDLIESADSILAMRRSCEAVLGHVSSMESRFSTLKASTGAAKLTPTADRARKRKEVLYSVSCRVKYLVDTPEKIWGCLDEHLYLEAAERYVRAREVHTLLASQQGPHPGGPLHRGLAAQSEGEEDPAARSPTQLLAYFPLLRHQWPLVETFKQQISQRSYERLQHQGAPVQEYSVALAATAVIDGLSCQQVLALFLESRRLWVRGLLRQASIPPEASSKSGAPGLGIPEALSRVVSVIQVSVCHAGQLFLDVASAAQRRPLFFATLLQTPPESQLFGGVPGPEAEVEAWKVHREALETQAGAGLPSLQVSDAVRQWMQACASDLIAEGKALLDSVAHISSLALAEARIREAIADKGAFAGSLEWLAAAFGRAPEVPWDAACELLLREPVDLWSTLFEGLFTQRAKDIIHTAFLDVRIVEEIEAVLSDSLWDQDPHMQQPQAAERQAGVGQPGEEEQERGREGWRSPQGSDWSSRGRAWDAQQLLLEEFMGPHSAGIASLLGDSSLAHTASTPGSSGSAAGGRGPSWDAPPLAVTKSHSGETDSAGRPGAIQRLSHKLVLGIRLRVDALLHTALQDTLAYLVAAPDAALAASRTRDLAPCLQSAAFNCFSGILRGLEQQLHAVWRPGQAAQGAQAEAPAPTGVVRAGVMPRASTGEASHAARAQVERALLIGRVCSALAKHSLWLPVVLGPPDDWASAGLALALGSRPHAHAPSSTPASLSSASHRPMGAELLDPASSAKGIRATCDGAALLEAITVRRKQRSSGAFSGRESASAALARRSTSSTGPEGAQTLQHAAARDTSRLRDILRGLRRLSVVSHQPWVEQTACRLVSAFSLSLQSDEALSTSTPLKGWEETVVKQAAVDAKGSDVEMKMLLPAMPSSYALALLYCACASIHRTAAAGGTDGPSGALDPAVLQMLAWKLDTGVLESFEALVAEISGAQKGTSGGGGSGAGRFPRVSEKGVLQLLFDLRFLSDALCGGQDVDPLALPELPSAPGDALLLADLGASGAGATAGLSQTVPSRYMTAASATSSSGGGSSAASGNASGASKDAATAALAAAARRKRRVSAALEALHECLDPIDWAAYEPYLWQNEQRFYLRSAVLLGSLVQLQRLYSDVNMRRQRQPYSRQTEANVLNTAPPAPRFVFLPISSPTTSSSSTAPKKRPSVFGDKAGAAAAVSAFGRLSTDAPGATASQGGMPGLGPLDPLAALSLAADSSGLTSAISGGATPLIRSLMGQVTLGSILTDGGAQSLVGRNISSLGDMLPSQAAGLFSSLTAQSQGQGNAHGG